MLHEMEKNEYDDFEIIIESDDEENEIIYDDNPEKNKYFIGYKIAKLLGYKNSRDSIHNHVKSENKISLIKT